MPLYAASIFLSAFLLFQIQPLIGKYILPWFGGVPALWSTMMLFFQSLLTGGYAYANWLVRRFQPGWQKGIHIAILGMAIILLIFSATKWPSPITPNPAMKPQSIDLPILDIFKLLLISVGLPYFILASNGPLVQSWFSRARPNSSYARLYSLSNFGSLLGLIAYPVFIEPALSLRQQGWTWSVGFILFGLLTGAVTARNEHTAPLPKPQLDPNPRAESPSRALALLWIGLSASASMFLLSVTNQISQEVAVIPFLWIAPLVIYLGSFILTFSGEGAYNRTVFTVLFAGSAALALFVILNATALHIYWQIAANCLLLFAACMICHGELYLLRPRAEYLTRFYLMVSLGGAFGGIFVSLIAPFIFNGYWEFFVALAMAMAVILTAYRNTGSPSSRAPFIITVFALATITLAAVSRNVSDVLVSERNFYGVVRVRVLPVGIKKEPAYVMSHGITVHGMQFIDTGLRELPTTYYVRESGAGLAILNHPNYSQNMRVGLLGLGIGTLAAYGKTGDEYRLYEINPVVIDLALGKGGYFSFLSEGEAAITTITGDARISLERELAEGNPQNFDVLVLDTFSSDSIPVHLVTREAFALYLAHLAPDGIIAAHITNLHLDLQPIFWRLAQYYNLHLIRVDYAGDSTGGYSSNWLLLAREPALLDVPAIRERAVDSTDYSIDIKLWTDDYSNLFEILK